MLHVYVGPSEFKAEKVVASFIVDAGLRGTSALTAIMGWGSPIFWTHALIDDSGTPCARAICDTGAGSVAETAGTVVAASTCEKGIESALDNSRADNNGERDNMTPCT